MNRHAEARQEEAEGYERGFVTLTEVLKAERDIEKSAREEDRLRRESAKRLEEKRARGLRVREITRRRATLQPDMDLYEAQRNVVIRTQLFRGGDLVAATEDDARPWLDQEPPALSKLPAPRGQEKAP